jgi:hypothetical protein
LTRRKKCVGNSYPSCATVDLGSDGNPVPPRPTGLHTGNGKLGDGLAYLLWQAGVGRIAAPGTAGQFRPHLVSLGFPLGRLHLVASRAGDLGEIVVVAG